MSHRGVRSLATLLVTAALLSGASPATAQVEMTYLGNEGMLLRSSEAAVLIDALHGPYKGYATAPAAVRAILQQGRPPYHDVDLVLVSHVHGDHFDAAMVARHLEANRKARLVSSDQATGSVLAQLSPRSEAAGRLQAVPVRPGESTWIRPTPHLAVRVLALPHGGRPWSEIRNLGHIIEIGGVRILHVGDADVDPATFAGFRLVDEKIDVALLPDWYLAYEDGQRLVQEHIRPSRVLAVHVLDENREEVTRRIESVFPAATILTRIGTRIRIPRE